MPDSTLLSGAVNDYEEDPEGVMVSHDTKSFQTGAATAKAFPPERLYEEADCIHVDRSSQKTREPSQAANRLVDSHKNMPPTSDQQPTSQQSQQNLPDIIDEEDNRNIKVKFKTSAVHSGVQSGTSDTRPIQTAYSMRDLPDKLTSGKKGMLKSPTQN